jgi:NACHT domain
VTQTFKSTALPAAGYLYQNLVGLEILLDWLDEPTRFSWVVLECEEADLAPIALDDIVAEYADGTRLYLQVKCANDPDDPDSALSWNWLFEKRRNRRSLIRKLFDAWRELPDSARVQIALVTNRRPDRGFDEGLVGSFIDWNRVSLDVKKKLIQELGAESDLIPFVSRLDFRHSKSHFPLLQERLRDRFASRYGDDLAWANFKSEALEWLVLKGRNRITLEEVRRIAAKTRPRPLREDFEVPSGYCVPDEVFHEEFLEKVVTSKGGGFVLVGSPGQGKSTYLSYLCGELSKREIPFIRHHYFLPVEHSNPRRLFMDDVSNMLIHQIEERYPQYRPELQPTAENLREWVASCAAASSGEGKPFVAIIDGLDHVWRENQQDLAPLEALLTQLLPLPSNLVLLLGTQPLSDELMPPTLRQAWSYLSKVPMPGMSIRAIAGWVSKQIETERFSALKAPANGQEYIDEVADALFQISSGHPLHVIYSLEMLLDSGHSVTSYEIERLPPCPDGDIRKYYETLWLQVGYVAQNVLHLISAFEFLWSRDALLVVLGDSSETASALSSIRHLTYATPLGLKPFHSSLAAYVTDHPEHGAQVQRFLPRVIEWLKDRAPDYLQWGWLWLIQARSGEPQELVDRPSWDWALDSLLLGYPPFQMVRITEEAEKVAFRNENFARAVELRWLKTRLLNGPDFQTDDFSRLTALTLELSQSTVMVEEMLQDLGGASTKNLNVLGQYLVIHGRLQDAERCLEEVRIRFNRKIGVQIRSSGRSAQEIEMDVLINLLGASGKYDARRLMTWLNRCKPDREKVFIKLVLAISRQRDMTRMLALVSRPKTKGMQRALELEAIRLACRLSIDLSKWPEFQQFKFHPLSACWALIHRVRNVTLPDHEIPEELLAHRYFSLESEQILEDWLHWHFFWCLAKSFMDVAAIFPTVELLKVPWISTALPGLQEAAKFAGQRLRRGDRVGFSHIWRFLHSLDGKKEYDDYTVERCLRRAMVHIAIDLGLLDSSRYDSVPVSISDMEVAIASGHFYRTQLTTRCLKRGEQLLTAEDAAIFVSGELESLAKTVTPFNERVEQYFDLAKSCMFGVGPSQLLDLST